jgi:hypothetical protein
MSMGESGAGRLAVAPNSMIVATRQYPLPDLVDEAIGERADGVHSAASPAWEMERPFRYISGYRE